MVATNSGFLRILWEVLRKYDGISTTQGMLRILGTSNHSCIVKIRINNGDCTTALISACVLWVSSIFVLLVRSRKLQFFGRSTAIPQHGFATKIGHEGFSGAKNRAFRFTSTSLPSICRGFAWCFMVFQCLSSTLVGPHHLFQELVTSSRPPHRRRGDIARCATAGCGVQPPWKGGLQCRPQQSLGTVYSILIYDSTIVPIL